MSATVYINHLPLQNRQEPSLGMVVTPASLSPVSLAHTSPSHPTSPGTVHMVSPPTGAVIGPRSHRQKAPQHTPGPATWTSDDLLGCPQSRAFLGLLAQLHWLKQLCLDAPCTEQHWTPWPMAHFGSPCPARVTSEWRARGPPCYTATSALTVLPEHSLHRDPQGSPVLSHLNFSCPAGVPVV